MILQIKKEKHEYVYKKLTSKLSSTEKMYKRCFMRLHSTDIRYRKHNLRDVHLASYKKIFISHCYFQIFIKQTSGIALYKKNICRYLFCTRIVHQVVTNYYNCIEYVILYFFLHLFNSEKNI